MIERVFIKNCLSFDKIELDLKPGLIVFTGSSGAGKTVLMNAILSLIGNTDAESEISELVVDFPFDLDNYENNEVSIIQQTKKEKNRFFLNDLSISRKKLSSITNSYIDSMNVKDFSIFERLSLVNIIDNNTCLFEDNHKKLLKKYNDNLEGFKSLSKKLSEILINKENLQDNKDFLEFEINKIKQSNPISDEEIDELKSIKEKIQNKTKVEELIYQTEGFFDKQGSVLKLLNFLNIDTSDFEEKLNDVQNTVFEAQSEFEDLQYVDIDETLTRLEELNGLTKKYGSIADAIIVLNEKEKELSNFSNIETDEIDLRNEIDNIKKELEKLDDEIFLNRKKHIDEIKKKLSKYAEMVLLENLEIDISNDGELDNPLGKIEVSIKLNNTQLTKLSSGELNRLKLALLALKSEYQLNNNSGVLILDEIDANLSGKESESVGRLLHHLSRKYQIISISHQPQLTSFANQHFLVKKENNVSSIVELDQKNKQNEIARMISGNDITDKALVFADELLLNSQSLKVMG